MSEHAFIFVESLASSNITTVWAEGPLLDNVDPPQRILRDIMFYAESPGEPFTLDVLPGGTATTVEVSPDLGQEPVEYEGKSGWRLKFTEETTFKVKTTPPFARKGDGLAADIAIIRTRVMIKFPPGLGVAADLLDEDVVPPIGTYEVHYAGSDVTSVGTGNSIRTWATGEKHDTKDPPTRTIKSIHYGARSQSEKFTMTVMPAGGDGSVSVSAPSEPVSGGGRKVVFAAAVSSTEVVTLPDTAEAASPGDKRIPTTVKIKFPSGGEGPP